MNTIEVADAPRAADASPRSDAVALEMQGIDCGFGTQPVLERFGLSVRRGECYALLGRNGAGKTTALRIACGLHAPQAGSIRVLGHDMASEPLLAKRPLAWLPDEPVLYDTLTAGEYLEFVGALWSMDAALVRERSIGLLAQLQLADAADRYLGTYSRGMRQRVALAGALLHEPDLIVMDEPFTGLDPVSARHVRLVLAQRLEAGAAVLLSTHLIDLAERLATRIGVLDRGVVRVEGTVAEIRARAPGGIEDAFADIVAEAC
jgi:ABC-2 type transport system ATP-binding protein